MLYICNSYIYIHTHARAYTYTRCKNSIEKAGNNLNKCSTYKNNCENSIKSNLKDFTFFMKQYKSQRRQKSMLPEINE